MFFRKKPAKAARLDPNLVETVRRSNLFDAEWYLSRYPETAAFGPGPLAHFCEYGLREHRDPGPNFSTRKYVERRPQAAGAGLPPFLHAMNDPSPESRRFWLSDDTASLRFLLERSRLFDADWYRARHYDVGRSGLEPIAHYVVHGAIAGRDPGPGFDSQVYGDLRPDWPLEAASAIEHFLRCEALAGAGPGPRLGDTAHPGRYERWLAAYDALTEADLTRIRADGAEAALPPVLGLRIGAPAPGEEQDQAGVAWTETAFTAPGAAAGVLAGLGEGALVLIYGAEVRLRPHAAYVLASTLLHGRAEAAYADHEVTVGGRPVRPVFKPAMSPEFMARLPYAGPLAAVRVGAGNREAVSRAVDAAVRGDTAAALAGLLLGIDRAAVARAPYLLFSLPGLPREGVHDIFEPAPDTRPPPEPAESEADTLPSLLPSPLPSVRIVIPTRDRAGLLKACIDSILAETDYPGSLYGITVVDNDSRDEETAAYFATLRGSANITVVPSPGPFNFAKICNEGAAGAEAEILVFLNNDMTVKRRDWLRRLVAFARRPDIGVVGAQLLYPDDAVQHGGTALGVEIVGAHRLHGVEAAEAARRDVTREMVAVTGACLAIRRNLFREIGGFDQALQVAFNDVKLCIDVFNAGYRNLYLAEPLLYHHESVSRGHDTTPEQRRRNAREIVYMRERYAGLLSNDPTYSPNLSLQTVGALGFPPRLVRPWRRSTGAGRVLILSRTHEVGSGVAVVVARQAEVLRERGWEVFVGGPAGRRDIAYPGCTRVPIGLAGKLAEYAVREAMDCVIVHTPPYFSLTRHLGDRPLVYVYDHGAPPPALFSDRREREEAEWEKRLCVPGAKRVFTVSRAVQARQYRRDAIVLRNGNSHLSAWSDDWAGRREALRRGFGFEGRFVVLNVCRFGRDERVREGIDRYGELAQQLPFSEPGLAGRQLFALAGQGGDEDADQFREGGVRVFADLGDAEMAELYAASDLYVSLSHWEGYNLGIGQARAMGLPVIASDIPAHREFGVPVSNDIPELCALVGRAFEARDETARARSAVIDPWETPLTRLAQTMEADLAQDRGCLWA